MGLLLVAPQPALADHQTNNWSSSTHTAEYTCCYTYHSASDSFRAGVWMTWSSTRAANMRANRAKSLFFTIDQNDLGHNVSAYSYATSIPNPYWDRDDDNGDRKWDESEIVSESASFPAANVGYIARTFWSHSYQGHAGNWLYDPDSGYIEFDENLSVTGCPIVCDKYDTHCCNINLNINRFYPANPEGSGLVQPSEPTDLGSGAVGNDIDEGAAADVRLFADLSSGLDAYAAHARSAARDVIRNGEAVGVVTFSHPIAWDELARLQARSSTVFHELELVSDVDTDGLRWTVGGNVGPGLVDAVSITEREQAVTMLGVIAAIVTVPDAKALAALTDDQSVYLVDLSIAEYERDHPDVETVTQNDVYWILAGWNR